MEQEMRQLKRQTRELERREEQRWYREKRERTEGEWKNEVEKEIREKLRKEEMDKAGRSNADHPSCKANIFSWDMALSKRQ